MTTENREAIADLRQRAQRTEDVRELRRASEPPPKPNGHRASCVCRDCFETWLEERAELARQAEFLHRPAGWAP